MRSTSEVFVEQIGNLLNFYESVLITSDANVKPKINNATPQVNVTIRNASGAMICLPQRTTIAIRNAHKKVAAKNPPMNETVSATVVPATPVAMSAPPIPIQYPIAIGFAIEIANPLLNAPLFGDAVSVV